MKTSKVSEMRETTNKAWNLCHKVTVEPVLFLYMLGIFLLFSVFQNLVYQMVCLKFNNETICDSLYEHEEALNVVQAESSFWIRTSTICMVVPSILVDCYLGSWSDIFGRKTTLILPVVGALLGTIVYILLVVRPNMGVEFILMASTLQGLFGSFTSLLTGVLAYIGAISGVKGRTTRMSVLLSMSFVAGTFGPFCSGILATNISPLSVFISIAACHILAILYTLAFVKDLNEKGSKSKEKISAKSVFCLKHLKESFRICFLRRDKDGRTKIVLLMIMAFIVMTITAGEMDIAFLYMRDSPLMVPFSMFSYWFGCRYGLSSLALLILLPIMKEKFHCSDAFICLLGLVSKLASLCVLGSGRTQYMIFVEAAVGCLNQFALTSIRAMLSQSVPESDQGKMFGLLAVFEDISILAGALIFNSLYPLTRSFFNGTLFLGSAAALVIPIALNIRNFSTEQKISIPTN